MNARHPAILAVFVFALLASICACEAQAIDRWPPWQSYGEAESAARAKQKRRAAVPRQSEINALNRQVEQLEAAGDRAKAIAVAERALQLTERRYGRNHAQTAVALTRLADLMIAERRYADAEPLLKRALGIREKDKSSSAGDIAIALDNLAVLYQKQGRAKEAVPLTQRAVAYRDKQLASDPSVRIGRLRSLSDAPSSANKERKTKSAEKKDAGPATTGKEPTPDDLKRALEGAKSRSLAARKPAARKYVRPDTAERMRTAPPPAAAPSAAPPPAAAPQSAQAPPLAPRSAEAPPAAAGEDRQAARRESLEGGSGARRGGGGSPPQPRITSEPSGGAGPAAASAPPAAAANGGDAEAAANDCARGLGVECPGAVGGAAASKEEQKWDVVPVFYGTDRAEEANPKRLSYNADRGHRLELGRALVTVPKAHQVPQIERPWAIRIPYFDVTIYEQAEDPEKHFTMEEIKKLSQEDFLKLVRERLGGSQRFKDHALVFVHGYNTSFDNAVYRTAQIAYDLKFDGAPFLYSWPSGGAVASYTYDRESAEASKPYMREFLEVVVKETGAKHVSIIAHSMGNQPLLDVLKDMKAATPEGVVISQMILAAPDVDADSFTHLTQAISGLANGVTLYAAANDRALIVSRNFWGHSRAGDVPAGGPLVLPGIDTIDVTAVSTDAFAINHSGYAQNNKLLTDIGELLLTGLRPPDERALKPERVTTQKGPYWRYAAPATGSVGTSSGP